MRSTAHAHPAHVQIAELFGSDKLIGPPLSEELVELMELLFSTDEAELARHVPIMLQQPARRIARRANKPEAEVVPLLLTMARRKVIHHGPKGFALVPLVPGVYEKILMDGKDTPFHREFAQRMGALFTTGYMKDHIGSPTQTVRTIPLERAVPTTSHAVGQDLVDAMIDAHDDLAVLTTCQCRHGAELSGHPCKKAGPEDGCLAFGSFAKLFVREGGARFVTKHEMRQQARSRLEKGLVLFTGNVSPESPNLICACCDCCCLMLDGIIQPNPEILITAPRFLAVVDEAVCTDCGKCVKACNTAAHSLSEKQHRFDVAKCVGCGLCLPACEDGAIGMKENPAFRPPPPTFGRLALKLTPAKVASVVKGKVTRGRKGGTKPPLTVPRAGGKGSAMSPTESPEQTEELDLHQEPLEPFTPLQTLLSVPLWTVGLTHLGAWLGLFNVLDKTVMEGARFDSLGKFVCRRVTGLAGMKVEQHGLENLAPGASYLFAINHVSLMDLFVVFQSIPYFHRSFQDERHFKIPVYGGCIRVFGQVPVRRGDKEFNKKAFARAAEMIHSGDSFVVFPEGHRTRDGRLGRFYAGGFRLAKQAEVPVIPMALKGLRNVCPAGDFRLRPGKVDVIFGKPIPHDAGEPDELARLARQALNELLARGPEAER